MRFISLTGHVSYERARELQCELVDQRSSDRIEDTVLFVEHEPVVTRGRGLQRGATDVDAQGNPLPRGMPFARESLPSGISFAESERGGDLTYHGPGQLVIYPICKLGGPGFAPERDVARFLRRFEQVLTAAVTEWCGGRAEAFTRAGATGVWVRGMGESGASEKKLASLGIAVRKWVTYHGLAINCVNDLTAFRLISPCGFAPEVMTRLMDWVPAGSAPARELESWNEGGRAWIEAEIARRFVPAGSSSRTLKIRSIDAELFMARAEGHEGPWREAALPQGIAAGAREFTPARGLSREAL